MILSQTQTHVCSKTVQHISREEQVGGTSEILEEMGCTTCTGSPHDCSSASNPSAVPSWPYNTAGEQRKYIISN